MQDYSQTIRSSVEAAVGTSLFLTPWWAQFLADISVIASVVAQTTGAIIGVYGVGRLLIGYLSSRRR